MPIFLIMSLSACAPKFSVESKYSEFRNTSICQMINNCVKKHNVTGSLFFNLQHDTEVAQKKLVGSPYVLQIENRQGFIRFKNDSHLRLSLTNASGITQSYLLKVTISDSLHHESKHSNPGYFSGNVYVPGYVSTTVDDRAYVYYSLSLPQLNEILEARSIYFELETTDQTIKATLSEENTKISKNFSINV